jgi:excisionase family DNA binding protein
MERLWNHKQVADYLGISEHTVRGKVSRKQIPFLKIQHSCRFDPQEIKEWVRAHAQGPSTEKAGLEA